MITLLSLHNHGFSRKTVITVNQKVNCSLTEDMVTIDMKSHVLTLEELSLVDIFHVKNNIIKNKSKKTVH